MKYKIKYIFAIIVLPILGFAQIPTDLDTNTILTESDSSIQITKKQSFPNKKNLLENRWGNELTTLLKQTQKVKVFHVETLKTDDLTLPHIEQFSILNQATLDDLEEQQFQQLIMDTSTYYLGKGIKQCLFMPRMAVQLITNTDTVNALISMKCDLIRFHYSDTTITLNCDDGRISILDYFSKAFSDVVFVQSASENHSTTTSQQPIYYTTKAGDNWYKINRIAQEKVNKAIIINDLYNWNNIPENKRNKLKIGEQVVIGYE